MIFSAMRTRPIRIEEFEQEKGWWNDRQESERAWRVDIETIKARNYNLDIKNPNVEDPSHGAPVKLLAKYQTLQAEISASSEATTILVLMPTPKTGLPPISVSM